MRDNASLTAAGARENEQRAVDVFDGLSLGSGKRFQQFHRANALFRDGCYRSKSKYIAILQAGQSSPHEHYVLIAS